MSDDYINYHYESLGDCVDHMQHITGDIQGAIDDLESQVKNSGDVLKGDTAKEYQLYAAQIAKDIDHANSVLASIATQVDQGSEKMRGTDRSLSRMFQR